MMLQQDSGNNSKAISSFGSPGPRFSALNLNLVYANPDPNAYQSPISSIIAKNAGNWADDYTARLWSPKQNPDPKEREALSFHSRYAESARSNANDVYAPEVGRKKSQNPNEKLKIDPFDPTNIKEGKTNAADDYTYSMYDKFKYKAIALKNKALSKLYKPFKSAKRKVYIVEPVSALIAGKPYGTAEDSKGSAGYNPFTPTDDSKLDDKGYNLKFPIPLSLKKTVKYGNKKETKKYGAPEEEVAVAVDDYPLTPISLPPNYPVGSQYTQQGDIPYNSAGDYDPEADLKLDALAKLKQKSILQTSNALTVLDLEKMIADDYPRDFKQVAKSDLIDLTTIENKLTADDYDAVLAA